MSSSTAGHTLSLFDHDSDRYKLMLTTGMFNDLCHCLLQATPAPACCAPSVQVAASHPTSGCCRRPHASLNSSPTDSASWQNVSWMFAVVCSLSYALFRLSYALCSLGYSDSWSLGYTVRSLGYSAVWGLGYSAAWSLGHTALSLGYSAVWSLGYTALMK